VTEPEAERVDPADTGAEEQARPIDPVELPAAVHRGSEVAEGDALDQAREVDLGEDTEER
jgi:hypothetical protein